MTDADMREQFGTDDPYHDRKIYHKGHLFGPKGEVSPLCAKTPRNLRLDRELWTLCDDAVTCKKCLAALAAKEPTCPT